MVLKLIGPDGTTTEALGAERGTYTAQIKVPASGIESAVFGIRGASTMADGTTAIEDLPFDVDGLLFTTTAHPAPAARGGSPAAATPPAADLRPAAAAGLVAVAAGALAAAFIVGRRRSLRSA
jgi:hypothetical protein